MLFRGRVALGRERGRVISMGRSDCGTENQVCLVTASLCQDNCFDGDISNPNCTVYGKLTKSVDGAEPSGVSLIETKR